MYNKLSLIDFHNHITKLVKEAYYTIYLRNDKSWVEVPEISLDFSTTEDEFELPIVFVEVEFVDIGSRGPVELTLAIDLNRSDEFNIGHIVSAFERLESD